MPRGDALCARSHLEEESTFLVSRKEMMAKSRHTWSRVIRVKSRCAIVENPQTHPSRGKWWISAAISTNTLQFYIYLGATFEYFSRNYALFSKKRKRKIYFINAVNRVKNLIYPRGTRRI